MILVSKTDIDTVKLRFRIEVIENLELVIDRVSVQVFKDQQGLVKSHEAITQEKVEANGPAGQIAKVAARLTAGRRTFPLGTTQIAAPAEAGRAERVFGFDAHVPFDHVGKTDQFSVLGTDQGIEERSGQNGIAQSRRAKKRLVTVFQSKQVAFDAVRIAAVQPQAKSQPAP